MSNATQDVLFISNGAGPRVGIAGGIYQTIISGAQTGGNYAMIHMQVPPGGGPAPHAHPHMQESFYVLEGTVEFITENGSQLAQKGDFIQIPLNGPVHCFKNKGNEHARLLCTVLPAGLEAFFEQAGQPLIDGEPSPAPQMDEAAQQRIAALAKQYGQVLYPPDYFSKRWNGYKLPQVIRYKTINHLLSKEFRNATRAAPPDDHITFYQNPEIFAQLLQRFLQANAKEQ